MATKVAVIYYSQTGTIHQLAQEYAAGAEKAGAEVRLRQVAELAPQQAVDSNEKWKAHREESASVPEATADDVLWADAVVFGTPTRYGNVAAQLKQFIDQLGPQWAQGLLADKVYSGFTSSATLHGGQESTLLALYNTIHHFGGFIVSPGYTDPVMFQVGNPYGVSHVDGQGAIPIADETRQAARFAGERVTGVTSQLLAGRDAALAAS
ncbi:NAD(P)H:quinone oxidoreductase [Actinomycetospora sp. TBRC 11914]|uniref:NAD(P)H:quinone oxidoreductase n=1 Tax=Actinomycetospora sp. TBRC 11914 TaxID=2729387 RepID=UPI00145F7B4F|nr:NAD(P)H:quinone oxidoreductase [Actinomycetospora sp. TBRC 11914]NMO88820.1 NAD(P)H:quinone oxidoreductase [Actinomycetospora sp. TBRC 11914]